MPDRIPTFKPPWVNRKPKARDARPSAAARGYGSKAWRLARQQALLRDAYQCQRCGKVVMGRAAVVDHIIAKRDGGSDLLENLQTLCHGPGSCHSKKTVREEQGGRVGGSRKKKG